MRTLLAIWIRLHRLGAPIGRRLAARRPELGHLDARTLRDIGLEPRAAAPVALRASVSAIGLC